ncbi:hypothetical protein C8R47DRAFT_1190566 [Mycena vitilis]|nr:hypothetical protein C8R47DRAFT_1190566 [Mycena vitilis]
MKNDRQQKDNTRAGDEIRETTKRRDRHMQTYESARQAMIALGALQDGTNTNFPPLKEVDTFMKSVRQARQVGDSNLTDGLLWRMSGGIDSNSSHQAPTPSAGTSTTTTALSGTRMETRKSGMDYSAPRQRKPATTSQQEDKREQRPEGWLWQLGKMGKLSQSEMDEWSNEGDRVQWFRAEAEMQRWQEQKEQKLVELLRTIRSFAKMQEVWTRLGHSHLANQPGHAAYARQKASMYERRAEEARTLARRGGHEELLLPTANIISFIEGQRAEESEYLSKRLMAVQFVLYVGLSYAPIYLPSLPLPLPSGFTSLSFRPSEGTEIEPCSRLFLSPRLSQV